MPTTILANNQPLELPDQDFLVIVHQQDISVKITEAKLISCFETVKTIDEMSQKAWVHISTGMLFRHLFNLCFDKGNAPVLPETIEEFKEMDTGVKHLAGLIIMMVECSPAFCKNPPKKIFLKNPETFLHPKQEQLIVGMITELRRLLYGHQVEKEEKDYDSDKPQ